MESCGSRERWPVSPSVIPSASCSEYVPPPVLEKGMTASEVLGFARVPESPRTRPSRRQRRATAAVRTA
jgi:hypothetical protein